MMGIKGWTTLSILVLLLGVSLVSCAPQAGDTTEAPEVISVTGIGEARGNPDMATVTVGVNVSNRDIDEAVEESNRVIEAITQALSELGIPAEDIQTSNFSIWGEDQWDPETGQRLEEKLYRVDSTLQVNLHQVEDVGAVLAMAIQNGANNVYGLNFGIDDPSSLADEARKAAIQDARRRAEQIAQELGVTLGEVVSATEASGARVTPFFETAMGMGGGGGEPPISEGQMTVSVSMSVSYAIER